MTRHSRNTAYSSTRTSVLAALMALLCSATSYAAATELQLLPYRAEYHISHDGLSTTAQRSLQRDGEHWRLSQQASLFFLKVDEESLIENRDGQLRPLRYRYSNNVNSKQNQHIVFDWARGIVSDNKTQKPWQKALKSDYSDQLSSQLQLRQMLVNGELGEASTQTIVKKKGKLKTYRIERLGEERLNTDIGALDTVKLRRHREGSSSETFIWLAPQLNYLIVKLEQFEDDQVYSLSILSAAIEDPRQTAASN